VRRSWPALIAALSGLAAVVVAALVLTTESDPSVDGNVLVSRPPGDTGLSIAVNNSPAVARNPRDADNLVATYRIDRPGYSAALVWSGDGGRTWTRTGLPVPADATRCAASIRGEQCPFAPDIAFAPDGTLYALYVNLTGQGNRPDNLWVARSTDGGRRFEAPVRVAGPLTFQPRLAVDPRGPVYVTWLQAQETVLNGFAAPFPYVVAVRSDDGARSFSAPVRVSDPERERLGAPSGVVDSQGRLVVLYEDFKDNRRDFSYLEGPPAERPFALVLTSSADGGRSFFKGTEIESGVVATRRFLIFLPEAPTLARGPGDELYVAWADSRNGDDDVFLRRSADGGRSWSEPVRVNDNPERDGTDQLLPKVAVAPDGRVDVLFLDRRHDPQDVQTDAYLASSDDGGRSFDNLQVSTRSFDSRVGPTFGPDYGTDFGTRLGLDSAGATAFAAWTDTRLGSEASGSQDVAFARVSLPDEPPFLLGWPAAVVLLAIGGAALAFWARGGNRSGRASPADDARSTVRA